MMLAGQPLAATRRYPVARISPGQANFPMAGIDIETGDGSPAVLIEHVWLLPDSELESLRQKAARADHAGPKSGAAFSLSEKARVLAARDKFSADASELEVRSKDGKAVILQTGPLGKAVGAMDKCTLDSLKDWGLDPSIEDKIVKRPRPLTPGLGFTPSDYPDREAWFGEQSSIKFRLIVDSHGAPCPWCSLLSC